ncbi:MAG: InlB B-repeat-containing protein, partial [Coriobacteriia bacterium]|nr:InlB B-repeat-containing protein [Coriobacteriia bacterium]MCL2750479.1 InlB B-repeat-containing protein [Coriobacteriia bacterium]
FVVNVADVSASNRPEQIKTLSDAQAWTTEGVSLSSTRIQVRADGGYTATVGNYRPVLSLIDDPRLERVVTAKVISETKVATNGAAYSIIAGDFILNTTDANNIARSAAAILEAELLTRAGVEAYKRSGTMFFQEGTKQLVSAYAVGTFDTFASRAGNLNEGDKFNVTFQVGEDPSATVTVILTVTNRNKPVLTVPAYKVVPVGAPFPDGATGDLTPSYMRGVWAHDSEDGTLPASSITHTRPVNTVTEGASFTVEYKAVDSDYNEVTEYGIVLIGNWIIVDDGNYAVHAAGFTKNLTDVEGTQAEVIRDSKAKGVDLRRTLPNGEPNSNFGSPVTVEVVDDGGYYGRTSSEHLPNGFPIVLIVDGKPTSQTTINVRVNDNRVSLTYFANGGAGTPPATTLHAPGASAWVADQGNLVRAGHTFGGWSYTGTGGAAFQAGNSFSIHQDTRLYAVWVPIPDPPPVTPPPVINVYPPAVNVYPPAVNVYPPAGPTIYVPVPGETTIVEVPVEVEVEVEVEPDITIEPEEIPLDLTVWSLLNLMAAILLALALLLALIRFVRKPKSDEDEDSKKRSNAQTKHSAASHAFLILTVAATVTALILFVLTQNLGETMALFDDYSAIFIVLLAAGLIFTIALFVSVYLSKDTEEDGDEDYQTIETQGIA